MSIPRLLIALLVLLLAALLAALCYLHFADLNPYRSRIASLVGEATGREFRIGGNLDVNVWPSLFLEAEQLSLANAPWGSQPEMAEVGRVAIRIAPMSLLFGPVRVTEFDLADVALLLEADADGTSNWSMGQPAGEAEEKESKPPGEGAGGLAVLVSNASISNIVVTQVGPDGPVELVRLDELSVAPGSEDNLQVTGTGAVMAFPLSLDGHLGTQSEIRDSGAADLALSGALGELGIEVGGHVRATGSADSDRLQLALRTEDIAAVVAGAGLELPLTGPFALTASLDSKPQGLTADLESSLAGAGYRATVEQRGRAVSTDGVFTHLDKLGEMLGIAGLPAADVTIRAELAVADEALELAEMTIASGDARLTANGRLATGEGESKLQLRAVGSRLTDLLTTLPPLAFDGSADVQLSPESAVIDPLKATVGSSDLAGRLAVKSGERTSITGGLDSAKLDLTEFAGEEAEPANGTAPAEAAATAPAETPKEKYVFAEDPLSLEPLRTTDAEFELAVQELVSTAITVKDLAASLTLKDGNLNLHTRFTGPKGGVTDGDIEFDASSDQADLAAAVKMRGLRLNIASGEVESVEDVPPIDITLDLDASGTSPRTLAAGSNGRMLLTLGPGRLQNGLLGRVSGDVVAQLTSALNPFEAQETHTQLECGLALVKIDSGLATVEPVIIQSEKVMILAGGTVDLKTEKLALEFNTQPRKGVGVSADMFVTPFVALRGTLASPTVGVNEKGTLLTAGAAIATGGLSFLAQAAMDRAGGAMDRCATDLQKPEHQHPPLDAE